MSLITQKLIKMCELRLELLAKDPHTILSADIDSFHPYINVEFPIGIVDELEVLESEIISLRDNKIIFYCFSHVDFENEYLECLQDEGSVDRMIRDCRCRITELKRIEVMQSPTSCDCGAKHGDGIHSNWCSTNQ